MGNNNMPATHAPPPSPTNSPVHLNSSPVPVPAARVFSSSSAPRALDMTTPNTLYMTARTPSDCAVDAPCFVTKFNNLKINSIPVQMYYSRM